MASEACQIAYQFVVTDGPNVLIKSSHFPSANNKSLSVLFVVWYLGYSYVREWK